MEGTARRIKALIIGVVLVCLACSGQRTSDLEILKNLDAAKERSKSENKPLLVYFYQVENDGVESSKAMCW